MDDNGSAGQRTYELNGHANELNGSTNGYTNGRVNGCILPWMTRWVWDNRTSWEETAWDRIDDEVGSPITINIREEDARGDVVVRRSGDTKEIRVTPSDRLGNWWLWKEGMGWQYSEDGGLSYQCSPRLRPTSIVVLTMCAVISCLPR